MDEQLSYKIAEFLKKNCTSFDFTPCGKPYNQAGSVWHGCKCKALGSHCTCVWHTTDTCEFGKWDMTFVKAAKQHEMKIQKEYKDKMNSMENDKFRAKTKHEEQRIVPLKTCCPSCGKVFEVNA